MKQNYILVIAYLIFTNIILSQTIVCEGSSCTANDYTLDSFYLGDDNGVPFNAGYCEPGDTVNAHIWTNFVANSAANRYTLYLHFNLYVDGVFTSTIDECYFDGLPIPSNLTLDVYNFSWECGADIMLQDFYMSWRPNANQDCGCSNAKCYTESEVFVQAPLISDFEFSPSCLGELTVEFISTTDGGIPPYTYLWDFGDGSTSTLETPIHTFATNGPYTVSLSVSDTENTDSYEVDIVNFDSLYPPELYPPPNLNVEGCSLADIPDVIYNEAETAISEAQFTAIGGSLNMSNAISSLTYQDISSGTCPITITRTFTVIDNCGKSDTGTQIFIIDDTTNPTASNPEVLNLQCIEDLPNPDTTIITDNTDNCSTTTVTFISEDSDGNTCPEVMTRIYRVTDICGNFIDVNHTIIINDEIAPTASNPTPITVFCIDDIPTVDIAIITDADDNCSEPTVSFLSENTSTENCPITITRTFQITDDCGNSITREHIITVNDTETPTATTPSDQTLQCTSDVPLPDISAVTNISDNCSNVSVNFVSDVSNNASCPEIITRTYSVVDDCNNELIVTQTFTVVDDIPPTASSPSVINVLCVADVPAPDISIISDANDNCSAPIVSFVSDVSTGQCPQIITRTYRVEDNCGNYIDILQDINVNDDIFPTASNLDPISLSCSNPIPTPDTSLVNDAADNCSIPVVQFVSDTSDGLCPESITRIYSVTDLCGNSINVTQSINFTDDEAPILSSALNDEIVNCDAIPPVPDLIFSDNCSSELTVSFNQTDTNNNNQTDYSITWTWTVSDQCGNINTFIKNIDVLITNCIVSACNSCGPVDDTIPPTASNPPDLNVDCIEAIPPPDPNVVTDEADNCVPPIVAFVSETVIINCLEHIVRTYSVTDECGNVIYVTHTINVVDTTDPTASNPAPININCSDAIPAPDINVVTDETDNCTSLIVAFVSDVSNNTCSPGIIRTYSISDLCDNIIYVTQEINIIDNIPPTANPLSDITLSCINDISIPNIDNVTNVNDNCSTPTVSFLSDISNGNTCPETITRTYRITDECGNFTDISQNIIIFDDELPTASNPSNIQVHCISDVPAPNTDVITDEADNCSIPTVAFISDSSDNNVCPETITRTYRVTDACGNFTDVFQSIIIQDDILPTGSNPTNINVYQVSEIPAPDTDIVTDEADNCSIPTVTFISESSDNLTCPETRIRIYRITDDCNNFIEVTQTIIINDNTSPTASTPATITVHCIENIPTADTSIISDAADDTSIPVVTFVSENSNNETCPEIITRLYNITDDCGNSIEVSHTIIIDDDILPTASNPDSLTYNYISEVPDPNPEVVLDEADNCGVPSVVFDSEIFNNDTCQGIITRKYRVTDACGNTINVVQDIFINDNMPPTATNPTPIILQCDAEVPDPDIAIITDAQDDNSTPTVMFIADNSDNNTCPETITRTYRVTDACGNYIDVSQSIIIDDDILPTASNPTAINVSQVSEIPVPDTEIITDEADNCSIPIVTFISESSDNLTCPETRIRVYRITDDCNNFIDVTQTIIIDDIISPTASTPATITVQCVDDIPEVDTSIINDAADDISIPTVTFISESSNNETCPEIITRLYNITDDCGNNIEVSHTIIVNDDILPTASNPNSLTFNSISDVPDPNPEVVLDEADNCGVPTVVFYSETSNNDPCQSIITRKYTVTDACGNSIDVTQDIFVNDNTAPTASNPNPLNLECETVVPDPDIAIITDVQDDNSTPTIVFLNESSESQNCSEVITRIYRISDSCGNFADIPHVITIADTQPPLLSNSIEPEITLQCETVPNAIELEFVDNCTTDISVIYSEDLVHFDDNNFDVIRTWIATDQCNNSTTVERVIHMEGYVDYIEEEEIQLCVNDNPLDLYDLVDTHTDGIWTSENMDLLDNMFLDPVTTPVGNYKFTYTSTTNNCQLVSEVFIYIDDDCFKQPCLDAITNINVTKLVTPNNDNQNDVLEVTYDLNIDNSFNCDIEIDIKIYNRWGTRVYQSDNYKNEWSGDSPNSSLSDSQKLPTGTYYYILKIINSSKKPLQGYIYLGTE